MTWQMIAQSVGLPLIALILANFGRAYAVPILITGLIASGLWQTTGKIHVILSPVMAMMIMGIIYFVKDRYGLGKKHFYASAVTLLATLLYWWMVRRFVDKTHAIEWVIPLLGILVMYYYSESISPNHKPISLLALLAPLGGMAMAIAIFGSIKIGVLSGTIASISLGVWVLMARQKVNPNLFAHLVAVPTIFIAMLAYHFAEISPLILTILLLNWPIIPISKNLSPKMQFALVMLTGIATTAIALWIGWPEQPLY